MRRSLFQDPHFRVYPKGIKPFLTLYLLRILVLQKGFRQYKDTSDCYEDPILTFLGFDTSCEEGAFNQQQFFEKLQKMHQRAEEKMAGFAPISILHRNCAHMAKLLKLDTTATQVLEFVLLIKEFPILERACHKIEVTLSNMHYVLSTLLRIPASKVKSVIALDSPLLRSSLIGIFCHRENLADIFDVISREFPAQMVTAEMTALDIIKHVVAPCSEPTLTLDDFSHIQKDLDILLPYLKKALRQKQKGINIFIHGQPGTGKSQLARLLAKELACDLHQVTYIDTDNNIAEPVERLIAFRTAQLLLPNKRALLLFDEVDPIFSPSGFMEPSVADKSKGWLNDLLETTSIPTIWIGNSARRIDPAFVRRFDFFLEMPTPSRQMRERILYKVCGDLLPAETLTRLAQSESLAPAVAERAGKVVKSIQPGFKGSVTEAFERLVNHTLIAQGEKVLCRAINNPLPPYYSPDYLNTDVNMPRLLDGLSRARSARLCLYGPPGTGKTALGHWLSEQMGLPLMTKRASDFLSPYVGVAEQRIAEAFTQAEEDGALLLIDEADSFLRDRRHARQSWEVTQVNEMLTQMESYEGILIMSTNLMEGMDSASLRRFDFKVKFDYLQQEQAWQLFSKQVEHFGLTPSTPEIKSRCAQLKHLTPGDFAVTARQGRLYPFANPQMLIEALSAESAHRCTAQPIGFVH